MISFEKSICYLFNTGYEEHICTEEYFDENVLSHPKVVCTKSKVADLCGLDMKVYFHEYAHHQHVHNLKAPPTVGITEEEKEMWPHNIVNKGATLLTFDPRTGFCDYRILGKAYVVVDSGDYPLSNHQVWGIQDLISEVRDVYHCDPDHIHRGHQELLRFAKDYRHQNYGPLTIYQPRILPFPSDPSDNLSTRTVYIPEDHIHHHHPQDKSDKTLYRHMDHSYGKYGRVRLEDVPKDNGKQSEAKPTNRRLPKLFSACNVLD